MCFLCVVIFNVNFNVDCSAPSRRGDMEILGFCMMQWLCKRLPWEDNLENKDYVFKQKTK